MKDDLKIKIIIADDHEIFIEGMLTAFTGHSHYEIVATCRNGEQLVRAVALHRPDIILTDISMPVLNGIEAIAKIKTDHPEMLCIVLTNFDSDHLILNALEAGAFSYVNKAMGKDAIFEAIASSINEVPYYCKSTSQRVLRLIANSQFGDNRKPSTLFNLSERNIIALLAKDMLIKEIARTLHLGDRTVERYKAKIMEKMGVRTTAGIIVYAIKNKLVILDDSVG